jgi:hypothetical protein
MAAVPLLPPCAPSALRRPHTQRLCCRDNGRCHRHCHCHCRQAECESLRGWAREQAEARLDAATALMARVPEDDLLAEIEVRVCQRALRVETSTSTSICATANFNRGSSHVVVIRWTLCVAL